MTECIGPFVAFGKWCIGARGPRGESAILLDHLPGPTDWLVLLEQHNACESVETGQ